MVQGFLMPKPPILVILALRRSLKSGYFCDWKVWVGLVRELKLSGTVLYVAAISIGNPVSYHLPRLVTVLCRSGSGYATLASKTGRLIPPRYEWRRREL